ncbi:MAG TPA: DUF4468 domain-containing protein [Ferruginibacter sp.]|jgi:hypothetical protein|nr:DUF4468 domain-containing protein [Ferruginibacter sp.]
MKYLLCALLFISLIPFKSAAQKDISQLKIDTLYQSLPKSDGEYEFSEIVILDSTYNKELLYKNVKLFFTDEFKSAKDVIQYDDREQGKVIGKGNFKTTEIESLLGAHYVQNFYTNFSLEVYCKDGKYKYRLYNITIDGFYGSDDQHVVTSIDDIYNHTKIGQEKKQYRKAFIDIVDEINSTISDLKIYMNKKESIDNF